MINIVFYDEKSNVSFVQYAYDAMLKKASVVDRGYFLNDENELQEVTGLDNHFIGRSLHTIQDKFKGNKTYVFVGDNSYSLYDLDDINDLLFVYRREISLINADITSKEADTIATWLFEHEFKR